MTLLLFAVGIGASRLMTALRTTPLHVARAADAVTVTPTALPTPPYGLTEAQLETLPWREAAARLTATQTERIKAAAERGDAFAQTLACLGHLTGAANFLPSPTAAGGYCDQASAQNYRAGLYLSWTLRRSAANAPITEAVARDRLARAAQAGLVAAQIDYAQMIAPDARAPAASQVEAGRLLLAAAEQGDPRGQYYYARWLRDSPAGPRNPTAAIPYLQHAADAGEADALHMLATFYRDGVGVPRDSGRARALYQRAAAQSFTPSMMNLADMLRGSDPTHAAQLYAQLACMRDEHQIAPLAARRLHAMGQTATCR
jgi:TPR repeat protein